MKLVVRLGVALTTVAVGISVTAGPALAGAEAGRAKEPKGRFLIISMPFVAWSDLEGTANPAIDEFMEGAAVGNLSTRTGGGAGIGSAYITLGAGTQAIGDGTGVSGEGFEVDEPYQTTTAGRAYEQRTGRRVDRGIVQLGIGPILDGNNANDINAEPGAFGAALRDAGYSRVVIGNADGFELGLPAYRRDAVNALMGPGGFVPHGRVDPAILRADPAAPYGVRLDNDRVAEEFAEAWKPGRVVLVEASDIVRASDFGVEAAPQHRSELVKDAIRRTDRLVAKLLRHVDLNRDSVMMVAPASTSEFGSRLMVAALRGPGVEPGYLHSSSTRRSGFVQLIDIAPTVLERLGIPREKSMHGRAMFVDPTSDNVSERRSFLIDTNDASAFRTSVLTWITLAFIALQAALALGLILLVLRPQQPRLRKLLRVGGPGALGFVLAVYLARLLPFHEWSIVAYIAFLAVASLLLGIAYRRLGRAHEFDTALVALGAIIAFLVVDVVTGSNIQFNGTFGVSAGIGIRLTGFGNTSYAAISASALLFAALVANRVGGRRGAWIGIAVMGVVLVADGAPFFGSDVGGLLSLVPAFGITGALLLGARLRFWRTALISTAAAVLGFAIAAGIDLARPAGKRTHLGRLIEQVNDDGITVFFHSVSNKVDQNVSSITTSVWGLMLPVALLFIGYLALRTRLLRDLLASAPELRAAAIGFAVLATLGYAVNDSGIVVPAMMLAILVATLVTLLVDRVKLPPEPATTSRGEATRRSSSC